MNSISYPTWPVERISLAVLVCLMVGLSVLEWQFGPGLPEPIVLAAYAILFICMRVFAAVDKKRTEDVRSESFLPTVSVIVAAHNEEAVIEQLVNNLTKLDYPDLEILIVDDRSTDATAPKLARLRASNSKFSFVTRPPDAQPGKAAVLNEAIPKLTGEVIAFFDADAQVEPDFIRRMLPYMASPKVAAVQARKSAINATQNVLTQCQRYEFALDGYMQSKRDTIYGAVELRGNGMLIRRSALDAVGGFSENTVTEDLDLCTRFHANGWDLRYAADVPVWEEAVPAVRPLMKQRVRWTEGSLVRYLEHPRDILLNPEIAFRTKLDLIQFVFECILPVWLLAEDVVMVIKLLQGSASLFPTLYAASAAVVLSFYFVIVAYQGVGRFDHPSPIQSLFGALSVYFYLTLLWIPIVFIVVFGILFRSERNRIWVKSEHFGESSLNLASPE